MQFFDQDMLNGLVEQAQASPRQRANTNIHTGMDDPVQRLFIAMEPGSYVRPHRHPEAEKWEFFAIVRGRLAALFFDADGKVVKRVELNPQGPVHGFEIPPNTWHTVTALESGSVFFEVKQGPYTPLSDKDFASWAPKEGEPACAEFSRWLVDAEEGAVAPAMK